METLKPEPQNSNTPYLVTAFLNSDQIKKYKMDEYFFERELYWFCVNHGYMNKKPTYIVK